MLGKKEMTFDKAKFIELILYVAERSVIDPNFGVTKMAKALWLSDFRAYSQLGRPITGATYVKRDFGPAASQFVPVFEELEENGIAVKAPQVVANYDSKRITALRKADVTIFDPQERAIIDNVIMYLATMSAVSVSNLSHETRGYQLAEQNEEIPYGAALLPNEPESLSDSEIAYGRELGFQIFTDSVEVIQ